MQLKCRVVSAVIKVSEECKGSKKKEAHHSVIVGREGEE
jgi:hypothetical protein